MSKYGRFAVRRENEVVVDRKDQLRSRNIERPVEEGRSRRRVSAFSM